MHWPMPILPGNRVPVISNDFHGKHTGVDIMYRAIDSDTPWPGHDNEERSKMFWCGKDIPALAYLKGKVLKIKRGITGISILIGHADGSRSLYCHILSTELKEGDFVNEAEAIGIVGGDPNDLPGKLRHLHFEIWDGQGQATAIDPEKVLSGEGARLSQKPKSAGFLWGLLIAAVPFLGWLVKKSDKKKGII